MADSYILKSISINAQRVFIYSTVHLSPEDWALDGYLPQISHFSRKVNGLI